jgi:chromosome segregation ATPase
VVFRLENINDKLNIDLDKVRKEKVVLEGQIKDAARQNDELQLAINKLREENFDLEQNRLAVATFKKELEIMSQKLNSKMEKLRKFERKLGDLSKARDGLSSNIL